MLAEDTAPIELTKSPGTALINLAVAALLIVGLYSGREIFVPLALAVLLSFVLSPFVSRLQMLRVPRIAAVFLVVAIGFSIIFSLGGLMVSQAGRLAGDLPVYQKTLRDKIDSLRGLTAGSGTLERASKVLRDLGDELKNPGSSNAKSAGSGASADGLAGPSQNKPITVEVRQPDPGALTTLVSIIEPLLQPLTTVGIVVIFVVFILLQRQDLRNRLVRLAGSHDIQRTTAALDDAGERLSKLFLTQIIFNAIFGLAIGLGLWLIGVPSAPLWGLIATIMRFVPYIGAVISAAFPLILAAAIGSGWQMVVMTAALFAVLEILAGQVIEPLVFGHTSGLSPVAIIVAASFWTWLWGPVGLVLATPLTVCLVVLGRHVERLKFLDVMFGDRPPLTPPQLLYQRMLAGDPIEASEQARTYLKTNGLADYHDTILLESLRLAQADYQLGRLDEGRLDRVVETVNELTDDLDQHDVAKSPETPPDDEPAGLGQLAAVEDRANEQSPIAARFAAPKAVVCIPGAGKLDEAASHVLARMLARRGFGATAESADALSMARIFSLDLAGAALICVCYLEQPSRAKIHYALRRLARKAGDARMMVVLLGADAADPAISGEAGELCTIGTLTHAVSSIAEISSQPVGDAAVSEQRLVRV